MLRDVLGSCLYYGMLTNPVNLENKALGIHVSFLLLKSLGVLLLISLGAILASRP